MPRDEDRGGDLDWLSAQWSDDPVPSAEPVTEQPTKPATDDPGPAPQAGAPPAAPTSEDAPAPAAPAVPTPPVPPTPVIATVEASVVPTAAPPEVPPTRVDDDSLAVPASTDEDPAGPPAPWWTTPMVSAWAPATLNSEADVEHDAESASEQTTAVMPQPLAPPVNRAGAVRASEATPVAALRHSSGRRVGLEAKRASTLVWVLAGVLVVVVLVGLFFVGQRLGSGFPVAAPIATPTPSATPTPTPTPTAAAEVTAMQSAGVHPWNTLFGGECLEPYDSPWAEDFTVVDCATAHTGQLVFRGTVDGDATTVFPGEAELAAQINVLCSAAGLIDLTAAAAAADVQVQGSYPVTDEQWTAGERRYYCFVSRSSGEPLTSSLAGPGLSA